MATERQKLIHLHGSARLKDATKLNMGEIAVTHAADAKEVELVIKNGENSLVYIPSWNKVDSDIQGVKTTAESAKTTAEAAATKTALEAAQSALTTEIGKKVAQSDYDTKMSALDGSISALGTKMGNAEGAIEALEETVGDANSGLVKKVAALEEAVGNSDGESLGSRVSALEETVDDPTSGVKKNAENISALQTAVNTINNTTIPTLVKKADVNPGAVPSTGGKYVDVTVTQVNGEITGVAVAEDFSDIIGEINGLKTNVNTLIGSDSNKSVRTIANEELAAQLLAGPDGAVDNFKTLQELAAWLEEHPESAAAMNEAITELQGTVDGYSSTNKISTAIAGVKATADAAATKSELTAATQTLQGNIDGKVAQSAYNAKMGELDGAISGLTTNLAATESKAASALSTANGAVQKTDANPGDVKGRGEYVGVTVTQVNGEITGVAVAEDFSSFATTTALAGVKATADAAVQDVAIDKLTGISKSESNGVVTFDFSKISINCGEY